MDITDCIQILCSPGNGLDKSCVSVEWREEYNRLTLPFICDIIEDEWNKKRSVCASLWNGSKFRLHRVEFLKENRCSVLPHVKLCLGLTCYKDFIGTNCAPGSEMLIRLGLQDHGNSQAYVSDPLGVGALVVTNDSNVLFIRRSAECAEFPHLIDRPGGHPEPDDVIARTGQNLQSMDPSMIVEEIFDSILKETNEEVNIPVRSLSHPVILGVSYNPVTQKTPSLEFYIRCDLDTNDVKELYEKRTTYELEESTELLVIPVKEILQNDPAKLKYYDQLTFGAKSLLFLFKLFSSK